ncbi:hypothetical protein OSB04_016783 [Centaurea solstitialis]|uniref:Uncharacterized protein n=1 Tax=Centaurea solstitialis TaxID=347529 RepID=A0AA38T9A7_9ASTR|nr:hypothetical protein OSB04_016783 [Centaurea solstitialis]
MVVVAVNGKRRGRKRGFSGGYCPEVRIRQSVAQLGQDQMSSCMEYPEVFLVDLESLPPDREIELHICFDGRSNAYRQSIVSTCTGGSEIDDGATASTSQPGIY